MQIFLQVTLNVDVFGGEDRIINVKSLPSIFSRSDEEVLESTVAGAIFYQLQLSGLEKAWHAANLMFEATCSTPTHHAVATLATDWSKEDSHAFVT
jgi:hypothetical protein